MKHRAILNWLILSSVVVLSTCATTNNEVTIDTLTSVDSELVQIDPNQVEIIEYLGCKLPPIGTPMGSTTTSLFGVNRGERVLTSELSSRLSEQIKLKGLEMLHEVGYKVFDNTSLFSDILDKSDVKYALAGNVISFKASVLSKRSVDVISISMKIKWELLEVSSRKITYSFEANSLGTPSSTIDESIIYSFEECLRQLLSRDDFTRAVYKQGMLILGDSADWKNPVPSQTEIIKLSKHPRNEQTEWLQSMLENSICYLKGDNSSGTGFVISRTGYILTNYHIIEGQKRITASFINNKEYSARLIRYSRRSDVALLELNMAECAPVVLGMDNKSKIGDEVIAVGNLNNNILSFSATKGIISGIQYINELTLFQTDAGINQGNTGGPLVDIHTGEVIGIVSVKIATKDVEGIAFAIDIQDALRALGVMIIK